MAKMGRLAKKQFGATMPPTASAVNIRQFICATWR